MELKIKEIIEKEIWENFLLKCQEKTFLSSWNWGEFQKTMGNRIWRLGIYENENLISVALVIKIQAKRGTFLFLPHGPVTKYEVRSTKYEVLKVLFEDLKKIAEKERISFIRISPIWERNEENIRVFKDLGSITAPIHMHPEITWELDITPSEDKLLMNMRKTTRYLIRQAQKTDSIEISQSPEVDSIETFNKLYRETTGRHHFAPFSLDYLKNEFLSFNPDNQIAVFLGRYKNPRRFAPQNLDSYGIKDEVISSAIIIFWQGIAFYHHGASSLKYPKIPVSYLLQWEAIREAKKRGCKLYNFWGISPTDSPHHPWAGLSLFKKGFGGYKKEYVKTQDFPLGGGWVSSKKYWLTYIFEKLRKRKRGL